MNRIYITTEDGCEKKNVFCVDRGLAQIYNIFFQLFITFVRWFNLYCSEKFHDPFHTYEPTIVVYEMYI